MPAVKVVKSITGYTDGAIHDSAEFGGELERLVKIGCLEPLEHLELSKDPVTLSDFHAEVETLTERIGEVEKERDKWKAEAMSLASALAAAEKVRDEWKVKSSPGGNPPVGSYEDAFDDLSKQPAPPGKSKK